MTIVFGSAHQPERYAHIPEHRRFNTASGTKMGYEQIACLAPDWGTLVEPFQHGEISPQIYRRGYIKWLNRSNPQRERLHAWINSLQADQDIALLCYCVEGKFCHRHCIADMLRVYRPDLVLDEDDGTSGKNEIGNIIEMVPSLTFDADLLDSQCTTLVNAVNCVGVMGGGLAKQFRDRFAGTGYFEAYVRDCQSGKLRLGQPTLWKPPVNSGLPQILNFPTKHDWREPQSDIAQIEHGLLEMLAMAHERGTKLGTLAIPMLGCGKGNLPREEVRGLILFMLAQYPWKIEFYSHN